MIEKVVCPLLNLLDKGNVALIQFTGEQPSAIMCSEYIKKTKRCNERKDSCIYSEWASLLK
jgi:hypothetical protein